MARKKKPSTPKPHGPRSGWKGILRFGLVSFAVQAINAHSRQGDTVAFHQLHAKCHSRIHYQKECPKHGAVDNREIVSGYEYAKGKYVEIEPDELDELRTDEEKALTIETFISPDELDPIYFDGRMYYLTPDGNAAREPYAIFARALANQQRYGFGQVVFSGKEQVVVVRPYEDVLHMAMLNYTAEIRSPQEVVGELAAVRSADKKLKLAEQLIDSWSEDNFDFAEYVDHYAAKVKELIEAKLAGRKVVAPVEEEEEPDVINLMDALRKSVERHKSSGSSRGNRAKKPTRRGSSPPAKRRRA